MEEESAPQASSERTDAQRPEVEAPKPSVERELEAEPAARFAPTVSETPEVRRGVLPPPASDGKRVQPIAAKDRRSSGAPPRPSASGLPAGMRAPGVPEETQAETTDVLIASAVAALTEGDPAENSSASLTAEPLGAAAPSFTAIPEPQPSPTAPADLRRRSVLWFGFAALAALALAALVLSGGDDDTKAQTTTAGALAQAGAPQPSDPQALPEAAVPAVALEPDLQPVENPVDLGGAWVDAQEAAEVGDEAPETTGAETMEPPEGVPAEFGAEPDAQDDRAMADGSKAKASRTGRRRREPRPAEKSSPQPPAAAPAKEPVDADALLADANKALASGQARKAYTLASKSRSARRSSAALIVMAKAACRFGGEGQAKSAFDQLSVGDRRGLRAECRNHGVRLGL